MDDIKIKEGWKWENIFDASGNYGIYNDMYGRLAFEIWVNFTIEGKENHYQNLGMLTEVHEQRLTTLSTFNEKLKEYHTPYLNEKLSFSKVKEILTKKLFFDNVSRRSAIKNGYYEISINFILYKFAIDDYKFEIKREDKEVPNIMVLSTKNNPESDIVDKFDLKIGHKYMINRRILTFKSITNDDGAIEDILYEFSDIDDKIISLKYSQPIYYLPFEEVDDDKRIILNECKNEIYLQPHLKYNYDTKRVCIMWLEYNYTDRYVVSMYKLFNINGIKRLSHLRDFVIDKGQKYFVFDDFDVDDDIYFILRAENGFGDIIAKTRAMNKSTVSPKNWDL